MGTVLEQAAGVLLALATFFAFPAVQYVLLRRLARREGQPEVWYLPAYGFRLVIRNIPRRKTLTDIRYRVWIRKVVGPSAGASVATLEDEELLRREDFFLLPGNDQLLLCFRLEERDNTLRFLQTDNLGRKKREVMLLSGDRVMCDYAATLQNQFNFDIEIMKRVELHTQQLRSMLCDSTKFRVEQRYLPDIVRSAS